jgi:hypothetical protein
MPANVRVSNSENLPETQLLIQWDGCAGCEGYVIERSVDTPDNFETIVTKDKPAVLHYDNDLVTGKTYYYRLFSFNEAGLSDPSEIVSGVANLPTAVEDKFKSSVVLFPNPASDVLHVYFKSNQSFYQVEVVNGLGQGIKVGSVYHQDGATLNLSTLSAGMYFVRLAFNGTVSVHKFIRK